MDKVLKKLNGLQFEVRTERGEVHMLNAAAWTEARKRLGRACYLTSDSAVYEKPTRFTLVAPKGLNIHDL